MPSNLPVRFELNYKAHVDASVSDAAHLKTNTFDPGSQILTAGPSSTSLTRLSNFSLSTGYRFPGESTAGQSSPTNVKGSPVNSATNNTVHRVAVNSTNSFSGNPNLRVGGGGSASLNTPSLNINHALVEALLTGQKIGNGLTKIASAIGVTPLGWTAPGIAVRAASVGIGVALYEAGTRGLNQLMNGTHQRMAGPFDKPGPIIETVPMDQPKIEPLKGQPINDPTLPDDMGIEGYNPVSPKWLDSYGGKGNGADVINTDLTRLPGTAEINNNNPRDYVYWSESTTNSENTRQYLDPETFPTAPTKILEKIASAGSFAPVDTRVSAVQELIARSKSAKDVPYWADDLESTDVILSDVDKYKQELEWLIESKAKNAEANRFFAEATQEITNLDNSAKQLELAGNTVGAAENYGRAAVIAQDLADDYEQRFRFREKPNPVTLAEKALAHLPTDHPQRRELLSIVVRERSQEFGGIKNPTEPLSKEELAVVVNEFNKTLEFIPGPTEKKLENVPSDLVEVLGRIFSEQFHESQRADVLESWLTSQYGKALNARTGNRNESKRLAWHATSVIEGTEFSKRSMKVQPLRGDSGATEVTWEQFLSDLKQLAFSDRF